MSLLIEGIREYNIEISNDGLYKNAIIKCEYWNEFGLHNISMKFSFTKCEIRMPDYGGYGIKQMLQITVFEKEIIIFCQAEYGDLCTITIKR